MARLAKNGFWAWVHRTKPKGFDSLEKWLVKYLRYKEQHMQGVLRTVKIP